MRLLISLGAVMGLIFSCAAPALAQKKKIAFSDDAIDAAVKKGVEWLLKQQKPDGSWPPYGDPADKDPQYELGPGAIATYVILESGMSPQDPMMVKSIDWLTAKMAARINASNSLPAKDEKGVKLVKTYEAGLLCNVYNTANRSTKDKYKGELEKLAKVMWDHHNNGGYAYDVRKSAEPEKANAFDNSNSQYGLLAVWAAWMTDPEVPTEYWHHVMRHWLKFQCADGGWGYQGATLDSTCTMTAAGVASMFVCFDALYADVLVSVGSAEMRPAEKAIHKGLDWFDKNFEDTLSGGKKGYGSLHYYLYGVERVGLASGYKYFGTSDWFKLGAQHLLSAQGPNGNWGDIANTSLALLFLVRGQHAVLFNKLEYDGDWRNRSRDLAMLTKWMTRTFEKPMYWQIINLKVPVSEWHDAPILYMAGSQEPKFSPEHVEKLKTFVLQGGTILCVSEGSGQNFTKGMKDLCSKMFPQYPLAEMPKDHDLATKSTYYQLTGRPKINLCTNGVRPLVIHIETDVSKSWQQQASINERWAFEAAANIYVYLTDRGTNLRPRGTSLWPDAEAAAPTKTVKVQRIAHKGNADPEPLAWDRFKLLMGNMHKIGVEVAAPVSAAKLDANEAKLAVLSGTDKFTLSQEEKDGIRKFIEAGGTVLVEAVGGSKAFAQAGEELLAEMYGVDAIRRLSTSSTVFALPSFTIEKVKYRSRTRGRLGTTPNIRAVLDKNDRPTILLSKEDLTAGMLGLGCMSIDGYDAGDEGGTKPGSAFEVMRNIVLSATGTAGAATTAPATPEATPAPAPAAP